MSPDGGDEGEQGAPEDAGEGRNADKSIEPLSVHITSPKAGSILSGDNDLGFDADVSGGEAPYDYLWTSSIDGVLSKDLSFDITPTDMGAGTHTIILKLTDASEREVHGSVIVYRI